MRKKFRTFRAISVMLDTTKEGEQIVIFTLKYPIKLVKSSIYGHIQYNVTEVRAHQGVLDKIKANNLTGENGKKFWTKCVLDISKQGNVWIVKNTFAELWDEQGIIFRKPQ